MTAFTCLLTGLPASGRSLLVAPLVEALSSRGLEVATLSCESLKEELPAEILDCQDVSPASCRLLARCMADLASKCNMRGVCVLVDATLPDAEARAQMRLGVGEFLEVYVSSVGEAADSPDDDARARQDEVHAPGRGLVFEAPVFPELTLDLTHENVNAAVLRIVELLSNLEYLAPVEPPSGGAPIVESTGSRVETAYPADAEESIRRRLEELGYI